MSDDAWDIVRSGWLGPVLSSRPGSGLFGTLWPPADERSSESWPAGEAHLFARAAAQTTQAVRPEGGRREGVATRLLESYLPHVARGFADLITLPARAPLPMPKGLHVNDAGEWLVDGKPIADTAEGRAWLEDRRQRIDWAPAMAMNMLTLGRIPGGAPQGAIGTFVGRKGAERMTEGGPHPAVDPRSKLTDREAIATLESRKQNGDLRDADVFRRSGWFWGIDGKLRKEIPDIGADLVATGKAQPLGAEYLWQHPAGNIHEVYNVPPVVIGPKVARRYGSGGSTELETGRIYIDADMTAPEGAAHAKRVVPEEIQHVIQAREGFPVGTHPTNEVFFPEYWKALGKPFPVGPEAAQIFREHREIIRQGVDLGKRTTPEYNAAMAAYQRSAGEIEAKNVKTRLSEEGLYAKHPRDTAANVPPQHQIVRDLETQRRIVDEAYLRGYFKPPWD